jgi:diadenylate cyclase
MPDLNFRLFKISFLEITIIDLLDIFLIAYILFRLYHFLRGTRAIQMAAGLILILLMSFLVNLFNLKGMIWIFENLQTIWLIAFVIVFQPELRRILLYIGQAPLVRSLFRMRGTRVIDEVVKAGLELSKRGFGGLIVMVRDAGLRGIVESGQRMQADVSTPLIVSIFNPLSPLHDGAIVIQNDVIEAAKCILPLSENDKIEPWLGTRHRAALGLSEESDAVIVIISEETRRISVAVNGKLHRNLEEKELQEFLDQAFQLSA